jgi:glycogen synthase
VILPVVVAIKIANNNGVAGALLPATITTPAPPTGSSKVLPRFYTASGNSFQLPISSSWVNTLPRPKNLWTLHPQLEQTTKLTYQVQQLNVGGTTMAFMHQNAVPETVEAKTLHLWQTESYVSLLAEKALKGAFSPYQHEFILGEDEVWLPTAESSEVIKAGGLAEVPVGLANGFITKGIAQPRLIMPLYVGQQRVKNNWVRFALEDLPNQSPKEGLAQKRYTITTFNANTQTVIACKTFDLDHLFSFNVHVADLKRNHTADEVFMLLEQTEKSVGVVSIEVLKATINGIPHLFLHQPACANSESFFDISCTQPMKATSPYVGSRFSEIRRFTFFTRALKELQWVLAENDPNGIETGIKLPKVLLLNDWQVGALASVMRYTAYYEATDRANDCLQQPDNTFSEADIFEKYKNLADFFARRQQMNVIVHNFAYQGEHPNHRLGDKQKTEYLYNLLFYKYAARIMTQAHGINDARVPHQLMKNIAIENRFNLMRMAVGATDNVVVVSPNYAAELTQQPNLGGIMQSLLTIRASHGTLKGIVNGYDKELLLPTEAWINRNIGQLKTHKTASTPVAQQLKPLDSRWNKVQRGTLSPAHTISYLNTSFDVFGASLNTAKKAVITAKQHNKKILLHFLQQFITHHPEHLVQAKYTSLTTLTVNSPIFYTVGRLVEQKGFDQFALAAKTLLLEIETTNHTRQLTNQPLLPLPIFVIQGSGDEKWRKQWIELKQSFVKIGLSHLATPIVLLDLPDSNLKNLCMIAADYLVVASKFEPCGLVQMEALAAGTPVLAMNVGGLKDTVQSGTVGYLTEDTVGFDFTSQTTLVHNSQLLAKVLKQGYETYVNSPTVFEALQIEAISQNYSWMLGATDAYASLFLTHA